MGISSVTLRQSVSRENNAELKSIMNIKKDIFIVIYYPFLNTIGLNYLIEDLCTTLEPGMAEATILSSMCQALNTFSD